MYPPMTYKRLLEMFDRFHSAAMVLRDDVSHNAEVAYNKKSHLMARQNKIERMKSGAEGVFNRVVYSLLSPLLLKRNDKLLRAVVAEIDANGYTQPYTDVVRAVKTQRCIKAQISSKKDVVALYELLKSRYGKEFKHDWDNEEKPIGHYLFLDCFDLFRTQFEITYPEYTRWELEAYILDYRKFKAIK